MSIMHGLATGSGQALTDLDAFLAAAVAITKHSCARHDAGSHHQDC